jgi:hypothetical protein
MPKERMHLGEVPDSVFQQQLFEYLQRKEANPDAKRVTAQFEYNGVNYTFQRARSSSGFQIKHSSERVAKESKRRGKTHNQAVKLSEAEQMMTDNLYEEAQKRGLQVDHKAPIAKGGPSNHPAFLGLMTPEENARKGTNIGGNYQYEPLIEDLKNRVAKLSQQGARFVSDLKDISQQAVDVKAQRMMDPQKRMPIDPKLMGPGGLAKQAVKEIAEEVISVGLQSLVNQVTKLPNKPRFKK